MPISGPFPLWATIAFLWHLTRTATGHSWPSTTLWTTASRSTSCGPPFCWFPCEAWSVWLFCCWLDPCGSDPFGPVEKIVDYWRIERRDDTDTKATSSTNQQSTSTASHANPPLKFRLTDNHFFFDSLRFDYLFCFFLSIFYLLSFCTSTCLLKFKGSSIL